MSIEEKMNLIVDKYKLDSIKAIYVNDFRAVFYAVSIKYGEVILKVNENEEELMSEYNMLTMVSNNYFCKVYEVNVNLGMLIEERIIPGATLREEKLAFERISVYIHLFKNIHKNIDSRLNIKTYLDWLRNANNFSKTLSQNQVISKDMQLAYSIGVELFDKYNDRVLLHGDLHHDNILMNKEGSYKIIDPKGVIGPKIFDLPRFILNEICMVPFEEAENHISYVILTLSKYLNYPSMILGNYSLWKLYFLMFGM